MLVFPGSWYKRTNYLKRLLGQIEHEGILADILKSVFLFKV